MLSLFGKTKSRAGGRRSDREPFDAAGGADRFEQTGNFREIAEQTDSIN
jgi:hypothetical protein